jgi:hypothetical protein
MSRNISECLLILALLGGSLAAAQDGGAIRYVATNGNDAWSGKLAAPDAAGTDGPFATLQRARDEIRRMKPAGGPLRVVIKGGVYALLEPLELTAEDSGTAECPVVYQAAAGETVRLAGGKLVTQFAAVTDFAVLERLDPAARGQVVQADLKALGITDFGEPSGGGMEVFFQYQPMTLCRWPNEGFTRIVDIVENDGHQIHGIKGSTVGKFVYEGDRPKRWVGEKEGWLHGYWFWDWSDQRQKIESIDTEKSILAVVPPYHGYGYRKGQWYYAFNLLPELDAPGEWYVDRAAGVLYFWPPAPLESGEVMVSLSPQLVTMNEASFVTLSKLTFEAARATAVTVSGGTQVCIEGCVVRNVGGGAVSVSGGSKHTVYGCDLYQMGGGGISLSGGDRTTLDPAGHVAENNHIHHYGRWNRMYQAAISINGVGQRVAHNLIHHAPHMAIQFGGNEHVIELNEIHDVCFESNDAGAMYSGRNWTMRGNMIRHNYLHHVTGFENRGCVGVYLDDMFASASIFGNVFYKVTMAAFIGGGRDNTVENNIFVDCDPALHVDARALGWAAYHADEWIKEGQEKGTITEIAYDKPPYSERYPQLVNILQDEPKAPKGNLIARNICWGGKWDHVEDQARPYLKFEDNLIQEDPHFLDAEHFDFRLKADSPAFKLGFKPIPVEKIGVYQDERRAAWPVAHDR